MAKTVTTPEQGKELLALGIPESTADFLYEPWPGHTYHLVGKDHECGFGEIPAWSFGALFFNVLPPSILPKIAGDEYNLMCCKYKNYHGGDECVSVTYNSECASLKGDFLGASSPDKENEDMIDCMMTLIKDLVKGGYLEERFPTATPESNSMLKVLDDIFGETGKDLPLVQRIREMGAKYNEEHPDEELK